MLSFRTLNALALATTALAAPAFPGQVTHSTSITAVPVGGSASSTLPQFDPNLGVLRSVRLSIAARVDGTLGLENTTNAAVGVGGSPNGYYFGTLVPWQVGGSAGAPPNPSFPPPIEQLAAYDGATDYAGASGVTHTFADVTGDSVPGWSHDVTQDSALQGFAGTSSVAVAIGPVTSTGPDVPPGVVYTSSVLTDAIVSVRYEYDAFPAAICRASATSGCPCSNASALGNGCGNSVNANGGALAMSGTASIANDTLTLLGSGMTDSNAFYFQGTSFGYAQTLYGDGLLCVGGTVRRLGTRTNVGGASQCPSSGGVPISQAGNVTQPGTRFYQVVYRDAQSYCTSATSNATSGLAILWTP